MCLARSANKQKMRGSGILVVFAISLLIPRITRVSNFGSSSLNKSSGFSELGELDLFLELKDLSARWKTLGLLLGLLQNRLDVIERDYDHVDDCYREMLHAWYDATLHPSWDIITWALDEMGQNRLAESIRKKYTHSELQNHSDKNIDACNEVNPSGKYEEQMIEIERKYILLTEEVYMTCKEVNLEKIKLWLTQIPVNVIYKHKHLLEGKYIQLVSRAESLVEVFGYLRSYWNFLDYGLLEYVALSFGNDEVKHSTRRYIHELTRFRKAVPLSEFMKLWPDRMDPPPEFSNVVTRLDATQSCLTLQDIEEIRLSFARNYSLVNFALMYGAFQMGSVVLMWYIPSLIVPQLVHDVRMGGIGFFKKHGITELSIDGHTVAIVDTDGRIWNPTPNISTPRQVGFWNSRYSYFLQTGKNVRLSCSKTCANASPPIWYHTLSKDPWLPMS